MIPINMSLSSRKIFFKVEIKNKKAQKSESRDMEQARELYLELAAAHDNLGHAYEQQGNKLYAQCEFKEADIARRNAA